MTIGSDYLRISFKKIAGWGEGRWQGAGIGNGCDSQGLTVFAKLQLGVGRDFLLGGTDSTLSCTHGK